MVQCIYSIPCECGRSYIVETGRPLAMWLHEHRYNLKDGLLQKSKLAQPVHEEGHSASSDEARILEIESNSRYGKYKELAHMACSTNPGWIFLPFGSPLSAMRLGTHREDMYYHALVFVDSICWLG
jgi:hypothetical protein